MRSLKSIEYLLSTHKTQKAASRTAQSGTHRHPGRIPAEGQRFRNPRNLPRQQIPSRPDQPPGGETDTHRQQDHTLNQRRTAPAIQASSPFSPPSPHHRALEVVASSSTNVSYGKVWSPSSLLLRRPSPSQRAKREGHWSLTRPKSSHSSCNWTMRWMRSW